MITSFRGDYYFLANPYECIVKYRGHTFHNAEAAYQSCKSDDFYKEFCTMKGGEAKRAGYKLPKREDWEEVKVPVMKDVLLAKFTLNEELKQKLLATGSEALVEGNKWHDNFWGVCTCRACAFKKQYNMLGKLLMEVREELGGEPYVPD